VWQNLFVVCFLKKECCEIILLLLCVCVCVCARARVLTCFGCVCLLVSSDDISGYEVVMQKKHLTLRNSMFEIIYGNGL
jgi:hypothetical protein